MAKNNNDYEYEEEYDETDEYLSGLDEIDEEFEAPSQVQEEKQKFRKPNKFLKKYWKQIVCIAGGALLVALLVFAGIKIFSPKADERALLYFTSNILCEDGTNAVAYEGISFELYNYADELRISKEEIKDIDIEVYCDGNEITSECSIQTGETAMQPDVKSSCNVTVVPPDTYANKDIEIKAISKPILKEIKATFSFINSWGGTVEDESGNPCALLNLTANEDIKLTVEWDPTLVIPETTNPYIVKAGDNATQCEVSLKTGEGTQIAFFKADPSKDYSNNSKAIRVSVSSGN